MGVRNFSQRYRAWARRGDASSLTVLKVVLGLAGAAYLVLRIIDSMWALPWHIFGVGMIASLDAFGAAWDRGAKVEARVRPLLVSGIFLA